jgi:hypothetical protein
MSPRPVLVLSCVAVLALALASAAMAETVTLPTGARIHAQILESLRSDEVVAGHSFEGTVTEPVHVDGRPAIPAGSVVTGLVTVVRSLERSGVIGVRFVSLRTPDGRIYDIDGVLTPTRDGETVRIAAGKKEAVVLIGDEADGPGKRASTLVGNAGEDHEDVADRWSKSGLSPRTAEIRGGSEITFELREPLTLRIPD